jgi:hypothetical protein
MKGSLTSVLGYLRRVVVRRGDGGLSDAQLLQRFASQRGFGRSAIPTSQRESNPTRQQRRRRSNNPAAFSLGVAQSPKKPAAGWP